MKKLIFLFIIMATTIMAGENNENNGAKEEFGIAIGPSIGWGLSYRHPLNEKLSLRVTGGYFHDNDTSYNLGIELDYSLKRNKYMDFFLSTGAVHTYEENVYYSYGENNYSNGNDGKEHDTRFAIGIGFSSYFYDLLIVSIEFHQVFEYSALSGNEKNRTEFNIYPMVGYTMGFLF